nr:MAG TPA: hypothetical protein [Caudoviricetes sp.]
MRNIKSCRAYYTFLSFVSSIYLKIGKLFFTFSTFAFATFFATCHNCNPQLVS